MPLYKHLLMNSEIPVNPTTPINSIKRLRIILSCTLAALVLLISLFSLTPPALACPDCTFPMKIGDGLWLMPNRQLEVEIRESQICDGVQEIKVSIRRADTHEVLATNYFHRNSQAKIMKLRLYDANGAPINAQIEWMDESHDKVMIAISCEGKCTLNGLLDGF